MAPALAPGAPPPGWDPTKGPYPGLQREMFHGAWRRNLDLRFVDAVERVRGGMNRLVLWEMATGPGDGPMAELQVQSEALDQVRAAWALALQAGDELLEVLRMAPRKALAHRHRSALAVCERAVTRPLGGILEQLHQPSDRKVGRLHLYDPRFASRPDSKTIDGAIAEVIGFLRALERCVYPDRAARNRIVRAYLAGRQVAEAG